MIDILLWVIPGAVLVAVFAALVLRRRPRKLKTSRYQDKWRELQKLCSNKENWPSAIVAADKLLDEALKRRRYVGKSMGERLTKAQRVLTDNEAVWFGHKLRTKLDTDPAIKLREKDVKDALFGIRQALKDLGALPATAPNPEPKVAAVKKKQPSTTTTKPKRGKK